MNQQTSRTILVLLGCILLVASLFGAPVALAADNPALLDPEPREITAASGDEFVVDVFLQATSHFEDDGVKSFNYTMEYNTAVLTATDVEIGPWMEQEESTTVETETEIDDKNGSVYVEQERVPPAGGVTDHGETVTATVSFVVGQDLDPTSTPIEFTAGHVQLLEYPLPVLTTRETIVHIEGGAEDGLDDSGDDTSDVAGVILAEDDAEQPVLESINYSVAGGIATGIVVIVGAFAALLRLEDRT